MGLFFRVYGRFFDGVGEKSAVFLWCFDGEIVVDSWCQCGR